MRVYRMGPISLIKEWAGKSRNQRGETHCLGMIGDKEHKDLALRDSGDHQMKRLRERLHLFDTIQDLREARRNNRPVNQVLSYVGRTDAKDILSDLRYRYERRQKQSRYHNEWRTDSKFNKFDLKVENFQRKTDVESRCTFAVIKNPKGEALLVYIWLPYYDPGSGKFYGTYNPGRYYEWETPILRAIKKGANYRDSAYKCQQELAGTQEKFSVYKESNKDLVGYVTVYCSLPRTNIGEALKFHKAGAVPIEFGRDHYRECRKEDIAAVKAMFPEVFGAQV